MLVTLYRTRPCVRRLYCRCASSCAQALPSGTVLLGMPNSARVSFQVCLVDWCSDANLRLLFTVLEKAPEPFVRSDIGMSLLLVLFLSFFLSCCLSLTRMHGNYAVIALSDLASRHHNLIAGWMTKLHSRLRDSDASERKNSLMVLSHLILNEMIKVQTAL